MKCPKCGADNEKDTKFCAVCGTSLETVEEQKEVPNSEKPKKKEKKFIFVALAGMLVIIAVIVAGIWVTKENQVKKQYQDHLAAPVGPTIAIFCPSFTFVEKSLMMI